MIPYFRWRDGKTNIAAALQMIQEQIFDLSYGDRSHVKNVGFLITDGEDSGYGQHKPWHSHVGR